MKKILLLLSLSIFSSAHADNDVADWRKDSTADEKLEQLISVIPSTSVIMLQMGERYKNLYWAAKQGKWKFANYQMEEMEQLIDMLIITRPNREKTAMEFKNTVFSSMPEVVKSENWNTFKAGFENLRNACMACHAKNDHSFITLPIPKSANSPVLGMQ